MTPHSYLPVGISQLNDRGRRYHRLMMQRYKIEQFEMIGLWGVLAAVAGCGHAPPSQPPVVAQAEASAATVGSAQGPASEGGTYQVRGVVQFEGQGQIRVELSTAETFENPGSGPEAFQRTVPVDSTSSAGPATVEFAFEAVPAGTYGIQAFLDENGNGELDMSLFGPTEPWGMYRESRPAFRGPTWDEIKFVVHGDMGDLVVVLE